MKHLFLKSWNRDTAVELTNCVIRLDHWLELNKKKSSKRRVYDYQRGKQYGYCYVLSLLEHGRFLYPNSSKDVPICPPLFLDNRVNAQFYVKKDLFNDALAIMKPKLKESILGWRKKFYN